MKISATIALICALLTIVNAQDCNSNPFWDTDVFPDSIPQDITAVDRSNDVTFNTTTKVFDVSKWEELEICPVLKRTGSCCSPSYLSILSQQHTHLLKQIQNSTAERFNWRIKHLKQAGETLGKSVGTWVDLFSKLQGLALRGIQNIDKIISNKDALKQLSDVTGDKWIAHELLDAWGDYIGKIRHTKRRVLSDYEENERRWKGALKVVGKALDITDDDIEYIQEAVYLLIAASKRLEKMEDMDHLFRYTGKDVDLDKLDQLGDNYRWIGELLQRNFTVQLKVNLTTLTELNNESNKRLLEQVELVDVDIPAIIDQRNIEAVAGAFLEVIKDTSSINEALDALNSNNRTVQRRIDTNWVRSVNNLNDIQAGNDLANVKQLIIKSYSYLFTQISQKTAQLAKHKEKCLKTALQYHGYVRCLACDAQAVESGAIVVPNKTEFSIILDTNFGEKMRSDCAAYFTNMSEANANVNVDRALSALYKASSNKKDKKPMSEAFEEAYGTENLTLIQHPLLKTAYPYCDVNQKYCTWIQENLITPFGINLQFFLLEGTSDELASNIDLSDSIQFNVKRKSTPSSKRLLADSTAKGSLSYSENTTVKVLEAKTDFNNVVTLTVDESQVKDITVNTTTTIIEPDSISNNTGHNISNNNNTGNSTKSGAYIGTSFFLMIFVFASLFI